MTSKEQSVEHFLNLIKKSKRGKFKIYLGMSAGVGKSFRMLQEAKSLLKNGVDVQIGYIETHDRQETEALTAGLPVIPRKKVFYKGKELEEMDMQSVISLHPEVVIVDELAHTNIEGSKNEKRWQDVLEILDAGINVISAMTPIFLSQSGSSKTNLKALAKSILILHRSIWPGHCAAAPWWLIRSERIHPL